jgi:rubrerythrin
MSFIVRSLERLFEAPQEIEENDRQFQQTLAPDLKKEGDPPIFRCRVCGLQSPERAYCPDCLADTMEPLTKDQGRSAADPERGNNP